VRENSARPLHDKRKRTCLVSAVHDPARRHKILQTREVVTVMMGRKERGERIHAVIRPSKSLHG